MDSAARCQVAQLTPPGRGAVATMLLSGETAIAMAEHFFEPASQRALAELPLGRIVFGRWRSDPAHAGEEVVVCCVGDNAIEVHCHGGRAAVEAIIGALTIAGCKLITWQDVVAADNHDPIAAEARIALAAAKTSRTAAILLDQLSGALRTTLQGIESLLSAGKTDAARDSLRVLQARASLGFHLTTPFRVVFAGRPNVGKSSLVNAILGYARAIVFDQPGTTRDVLTATTALDGWPVELTDTAGMRQSDDELEQQGVARARHIAAAADLVVLVLDASQPLTDEDVLLVDAFPDALVVANKCDLPRVGEEAIASDLSVSAVTGANLPELMKLVSQRIVSIPPLAGEAVPFTQRQVDEIAAISAKLGQDRDWHQNG